MIAQEITDGRFQAAKTEIIVRFCKHWSGKIIFGGVTMEAQSVNLLPGWIRQAHEIANFVEALASGIVKCRAEHAVVKFSTDMNEHSMATTNNERNIGFECLEISHGRLSRNPGGVEVRL